MSSSIRTTGAGDGRLVATTSVAFAEILARLAPGAASVRLNSAAESGLPRTAEAYDAHGRHVPQPLAIRQAMARWISTAFPLDRGCPHRLDLATGELTALAAAGGGDLPLAA
ncbi:hypothetical protein [Kitasatospora sp. NRRL B-11411]|uniref:hypothetical protein n=1 Tax=Kitasatospora sp. NRRL B-11411 TaxID=1463822 RepID=UPI0004C37F8A|nr:hypothetical protein [Kitasatospora sp. NRRL B-11411]